MNSKDIGGMRYGIWRQESAGLMLGQDFFLLSSFEICSIKHFIMVLILPLISSICFSLVLALIKFCVLRDLTFMDGKMGHVSVCLRCPSQLM